MRLWNSGLKSLIVTTIHLSTKVVKVVQKNMAQLIGHESLIYFILEIEKQIKSGTLNSIAFSSI